MIQPDAFYSQIDSLKFDYLLNQIESLSNKLDSIEISHINMSDVLSHQDALFTTQTEIFGVIVSVVVVILVAVPLITFFTTIKQKLDSLDESVKTTKVIEERVKNHQKVINRVNINVHRSLWLGENFGSYMKLVWHIRYCEAYLTGNNLDAIKGHFVGNVGDIGQSNLQVEYQALKEQLILAKTSADDYTKFHNFKDGDGIKKTLLEIAKKAKKAKKDKYGTMRKLAFEILKDLETNLSDLKAAMQSS